jgi:hypothetical protein
VSWFLGALAYVALHALVYATALRSRDTFRRERGIFAYHAVSAALVSVLALGSLIARPSFESLAMAVAVVCLHGIYSTSFLELWSLSQGSYSLKILRHIAAADTPNALDTSVLEDVGIAHRTHRLEALTSARLTRQRDGQLELAPLGRAVAGALGLIAWLANVRQTAPEPAEAPTP